MPEDLTDDVLDGYGTLSLRPNRNSNRRSPVLQIGVSRRFTVPWSPNSRMNTHSDMPRLVGAIDRRPGQVFNEFAIAARANSEDQHDSIRLRNDIETDVSRRMAGTGMTHPSLQVCRITVDTIERRNTRSSRRRSTCRSVLASFADQMARYHLVRPTP